MEKNISILIPVRNEEKKIEQCLNAVFDQTIKPLEVIVIDGNSTDNTVENAKEFSVKVMFENYHTRAGACQVGIENAKGEYIAFTDADCIPKRDWLESLIKEFDQGIVGVGGGIRNLGEGLWECSINHVMSSFLGSANSIQGRFFENKRFVQSISGCNSLYKKDDILRVGGFNVKLSTAEDTDLNNKLLKIGSLIYTPNAVILHNHKRGLKDFAKRMYQYGYGRSKSRLWDLQILPPIFAFILLISLIFTPLLVSIMIPIYLILLFYMAIKFAVIEKNILYLGSIPLVYIAEHILYTLGFWRGLAK